MYLVAKTLDDLMHRVLSKILVSKTILKTSLKGPNAEISGVLLKLSNPRCRLSRAENRSVLPSCLGEFLWYVSGRNDLEFIRYYIERYKDFSEKDGTIWGAYGPRLFKGGKASQIETVIRALKDHPETRQAVIQIFARKDILKDWKDTPCTIAFQFFVRDGKLNLMTTMRSNDAYIGLPHDIFAFTLLQEIVARRLDLEMGWYKHSVGSLHLYDRDRDKALRYVKEGWHPTIGVAMPPMPKADPRPAIRSLLEAENLLRQGRKVDAQKHVAKMAPYWRDLSIVLAAYADFKVGEPAATIRSMTQELNSRVYATYLDGIAQRPRQTKARR